MPASRSSRRTGGIAVTAAILLGTAHAQQPPDVVASDSFGNTAMGTAALSSADITGSGGEGLASYNTGAGYHALMATNSGEGNTAVGSEAMASNTAGTFNTAVGDVALYSNTTGNNNSAVGFQALSLNSTGTQNAALGVFSLFDNTTGKQNTACGAQSLSGNTTGNQNSALGWGALAGNASGNYNTAVGSQALLAVSAGGSNTAVGAAALFSNRGDQNTASGASAMHGNTTGSFNTAIGHRALYSNISGSRNIAVGTDAGTNLTTGSDNIVVGNPGVAGESGTIRIGANTTHTAFYAAGITGTRVTGSAVYVTSTGQLGVLASSERYKTGVVPMAGGSARLRQLQPVMYRLKTDPDGTPQYGLVAEAVARVYPELVTRNAAGMIEGVRYEELSPMLLNEMQKQQRMIESQGAQLRVLRKELSLLRKQMTGNTSN